MLVLTVHKKNKNKIKTASVSSLKVIAGSIKLWNKVGEIKQGTDQLSHYTQVQLLPRNSMVTLYTKTHTKSCLAPPTAVLTPTQGQSV